MVQILTDRSFAHQPIKWDCKGCGSTLLTEEEDDVEKGEFGGFMSERGETKLYVSCPICKTDRPLDASEEQRVSKRRRLALGFHR